MSRRKVSLAVLLSLSVSSPALFSEVIAEIRNWPAPPLWSAPTKPSKEAPDVNESALEPMAVAAVPTNPVPFVGITPCRIVDTRGNGFSGDYGPPALTGGVPRDFTLTGRCGLPAHAEAVSLNITVTNPVGPGFILVYPRGGAQPNVSTLNYVAGQTVANAAVVPLGTAGGITVIAGVSGTELIIDTNGYYGGNFDSIYVNEGQASSVSSAMITDGAIVNADVNASAAIADTKLATIATAGKVADSALSANVTRLGQSIETAEIADNAVTASKIANVTRAISIPLPAFHDCQTASGAFLDFTSGADAIADYIGDAGVDGTSSMIRFDSTGGSPDQDSEICSNVSIPPDYASGGHLRVLVMRTGAVESGGSEVLTCGAGVDGSGPGAPGNVAIPALGTTRSSLVCVPSFASPLAPGRGVGFYLSITSDGVMDQSVVIISVAFEYTATQ